jgi:hypothetical protein
LQLQEAGEAKEEAVEDRLEDSGGWDLGVLVGVA